MRENSDTCAGCESFPIASSVKNKGVAECEWRGQQAFSDRACVLFNRAKDRENRKRIVVQLMKAEG